MKASELMVGDWVRVKAPYFKKNKAYRVVEVREHGYNGEATANIELPDEDEEASMTGEYIIGIPLTPEILEKNFGSALNGCYFEGDEFYELMIHEVNDGTWIIKHDNIEFSNIPRQQVMVSYVHELQHALRLCGIEKEIVL